MAMVTCPKCKKTVSNGSNKCPNCGSPLTYSAFDKNAPKHAKYHMISNVFLGIGGLLLIGELLNMAKTYVGGILVAVGLLYQGLALLEREKEDASVGKKRGKILIWAAVVFALLGFYFLYLDIV